jgi:hypothetical protein
VYIFAIDLIQIPESEDKSDEHFERRKIGAAFAYTSSSMPEPVNFAMAEST